MFSTIKLNKEYWKKRIPNLKYGVPDPLNVFSNDKEKFSEAMTSFNFSGVYKTTQAGRHKQTQSLLKNMIGELTDPVTIIDIGASDGSTSLDLIRLVENKLKHYYVTDYNIKCTYITKKGYTYFYNKQDVCFLIASKKFVFYPADKLMFNLLFKRSLRNNNKLQQKELLFINFDLQEKQQGNPQVITLMEYNVFEPWPAESGEIVIAANLLNRAYFSDSQIEQALHNCYNALLENGILAVIRNSLAQNGSEIEKSTLYKKNSINKTFEKISEIGEGVEINDFILSLKF